MEYASDPSPEMSDMHATTCAICKGVCLNNAEEEVQNFLEGENVIKSEEIVTFLPKNVLQVICQIFQYPFQLINNFIPGNLKDLDEMWKDEHLETVSLCQKCTQISTDLYTAFLKIQKCINKTSQLSKMLQHWSETVVKVGNNNSHTVGKVVRKKTKVVKGSKVKKTIEMITSDLDELKIEEPNNSESSQLPIAIVIDYETDQLPSPSPEVGPARRMSTRLKLAKRDSSTSAVVKSEMDCTKETKTRSKSKVSKASKKKKKVTIDIHRCELCNNTFASSDSLEVHQRTFHSGPSSTILCRCTTCHQTFSSVNLLSQHILSVHEEPKKISKQFPCAKCEFKSENYISLREHLDKMHNERLNLCMECGKAFLSKHDLSFHYKDVHKMEYNHTNSPSSSTTDFNMGSFEETLAISNKNSSPAKIDQVKRKQEGNALESGNLGKERFKCMHCDASFKQKRRLEEHILLHDEYEARFGCSMCPLKFFRPSVLKKHIVTEHSSAHRFPCRGCNKVFTRSDHLKRHERTVHIKQDDKQEKVKVRRKKALTHSCKICDKIFPRPEYLQLHVRIHSGEKPFVCSQCGKSFRDPRNLAQHMVTHRTDRPYCCSECGMTFKRAHHLAGHEKNHINVERPFVCTFPDCGKAFKLRKHLVTHELVHKDSKDHMCHVCGKSFSRKDNLRQHINKVHGKELANVEVEDLFPIIQNSNIEDQLQQDNSCSETNHQSQITGLKESTMNQDTIPEPNV